MRKNIYCARLTKKSNARIVMLGKKDNTALLVGGSDGFGSVEKLPGGHSGSQVMSASPFCSFSHLVSGSKYLIREEAVISL